jgi:two-component SAPR family response regulator
MNEKQKHSMPKHIAITAYVKREERSQTNNLTLYLMEPEKEEKLTLNLAERSKT